VNLHGLDVHRISEPEVIASVLRGLSEGRGGSVVTANLDQLRHLVQRSDLTSLFERADLVVADGMPLVWASRLQGEPLPERVAGSDLVWSLTAEAALRDRSVFLLGGAPGACEAAEAKLRECYPGARFAGHWCPPVGFEYDSLQIQEIRRRLREAAPDIVYVALGFPKQERLIAYLRSEFEDMWFLGVGYSLSFMAGHARRAPAWMIGLGLEWLHRLFQEPGRLAKRYLVRGLPFAARLFARSLARRLKHGKRGAPEAEASSQRVVFSYGSIERLRADLLSDLMTHE
jgi:N-acetylglucosaminyldiphosphoundecaprenol N-acetyl-beta-D-mannosaminyltransferase